MLRTEEKNSEIMFNRACLSGMNFAGRGIHTDKN